jgi:hypothetical protein
MISCCELVHDLKSSADYGEMVSARWVARRGLEDDDGFAGVAFSSMVILPVTPGNLWWRQGIADGCGLGLAGAMASSITPPAS